MGFTLRPTICPENQNLGFENGEPADSGSKLLPPIHQLTYFDSSHTFSFAVCFAALTACFVHWLPVLHCLEFLRQFRVVEKTKNPSRRTGFWTTCVNALVTQNNRSHEMDY